MLGNVIVRGKNRILIGWFHTREVAQNFITRNDPSGIKEFHISRI